MESLRQQKIAQQLHKDLGEIFIKECAEILRTYFREKREK